MLIPLEDGAADTMDARAATPMRNIKNFIFSEKVSCLDTQPILYSPLMILAAELLLLVALKKSIPLDYIPPNVMPHMKYIY